MRDLWRHLSRDYDKDEIHLILAERTLTMNFRINKRINKRIDPLANFKILMSRVVLPTLCAADIVNVQPMTAPIGTVFHPLNIYLTKI